MIQEVQKVIKDLTGFQLSQTIPNYCLPNFDMNGNILSMCIQVQFCITYIVPNITCTRFKLESAFTNALNN